ncbi:hypothetical protein D1872_284290 [compost metagenome]
MFDYERNRVQFFLYGALLFPAGVRSRLSGYFSGDAGGIIRHEYADHESKRTSHAIRAKSLSYGSASGNEPEAATGHGLLGNYR